MVEKRFEIQQHWPFIALSIGFFILYSLFSLVNHYNFNTHAFDLGIFNQAIHQYSHFKVGPNTIRGVPILLADHFELILFLFSPLYWIFGSYTLLIVQILAIHFGALGVYLLLRKLTKDQWLTMGGVVLFYLFYGVFDALSYDYHNNVVGAMFLPWLFYMLEVKRFRGYYLFLALFLMSKENMALIAAFLGLSLLLFGKKEVKKHGLITFLVSAIYFVVILKFVIPALNQGVYDHWSYSLLGESPGEAIKTMILHPIYTFGIFFDHPKKLMSWALILGCGGILALFKPKYSLLMIPIVAQKFLSDNPSYWGHSFQYSIEFAPIIPVAATLILAQLKKQPLRHGSMIALIAVNVAILSILPFHDRSQLKRVFMADYYRLGYDREPVKQAMELIPKNASVTTQSSLVPHLTNRDQIHLFPHGLDQQYVLLNTNDDGVWPLKNTQELIEIKNQKIDQNTDYHLIYQSNGVYLYKKAD